MPKTWEERVSIYCAYLITEKGCKSSTIKSYVSAIKDVLTADDYTWDNEKLKISSLISSCQSKNDRIINKFPIQIGLLEILLYETERKLSNQPFLEILYKNIFCFLYYGLCRIGEVTSGNHPIKAKDVYVSLENEKILLILYTSKTHGKHTRPQSIKISSTKRTLHRNSKQPVFDPFKLAREYQAIRGGYIEDDDPYFVFSDNSPVKPRHVRKLLKELLECLNLNSNNYGTHSFRTGRATDLFKNGQSVETIKKWGRWKSNAVYRYLRDL